MSKFLSNIRVVVGGTLVMAIVLTALLAPLLSNHNPDKMNPVKAFRPPSVEYRLGTDNYGRDIFSRLLHGARISVQIALYSVIIAAVLGVFWGSIAAYTGGLFGNLVMRFMDILMSIPPIIFAIAIVAFIGSGVPHLVAAIGLLYAPRFGRIAYSSALSVKQNDYVKASRAIGTAHWRILFRDILPNIMAPIIVLFSLSIGTAILLETGLSFLGMGPPPPASTWGNMISSARELMDIKPLLVIWPSVSVAITVLSFNILGDGLRDVLDPRLKV